MMDRYHPSAEQVALAGTLAEALSSILPLSRLREAHEEDADTWKALRELDVFGISVPEERGGCGLGLSEEALIAIELGRLVVHPSVIATVGAAQMHGTNGRSRAAGVARVAAGYRRGEQIIVVDDPGADQLLVRGANGAQLFERPVATRLLDQTLWSCQLMEAVELGECLAVANAAQTLRLRLIDAAALAGLARAALDMAVGYVGLREQFGRPIGSFQAIKHHCTNMALAARLAADQVSFAAVAMDDARDDAALQVESALYMAGTAALENAGKNIQVHGGIGFSDEADPHRLLKRARVLLELAGGLETCTARIAVLPVALEHAAPAREERPDRPHTS